MAKKALGRKISQKRSIMSKVGPLFFENFELGREFISPEHFSPVAVTSKMIKRFAILTGDRNPLHLDANFCQKTFHKTPIAHGMLTQSLVMGMIDGARIFHGTCLAFLRSDVHFVSAVRPGDTLSLKLTVLSKSSVYETPEKKLKECRKSGVVCLLAEAYTNNGPKVLEAKLWLMIATSEFFEESAPTVQS
jgi:acyl dehydratase